MESIGERLADAILDPAVDHLEDLLEKFGVKKLLEKANKLGDFIGEVNFLLDSDIKDALREVGILSPQFKQAILDPFIVTEKPYNKGDERVNQQLSVLDETDVREVDESDGQAQIIQRSAIELSKIVKSCLE